MQNTVKIALTGIGNANRPLFEMLVTERERIKRDCGVQFIIVGASDSKGSVIAPNGVLPEDLLKIKNETGTIAGLPFYGYRGMSALEMIQKCEGQMLVECIPPNLPSAEPGLSHIKMALNHKMHVVTANKAPLAVAWGELMELAKKNGVYLKYGCAASAGLPTLEMGRFLGDTGELLEMAGIFNATCQYILEGMRDGKTYEEALKGAQIGGFAEADPTMDVEGWDTAMKTIIQANTYFNLDLRLKDVKRKGIIGITQDDIKKAKIAGEMWCLIGRARFEDGSPVITVGPERVPADHPLARTRWCDKSLWLKTRTLGEQMHYCLGASASGTPGTTLADMIDIARRM